MCTSFYNDGWIVVVHIAFLLYVVLGGLKLWECALDLTEYISSLNIAFRGLKVLEVTSFHINYLSK